MRAFFLHLFAFTRRRTSKSAYSRAFNTSTKVSSMNTSAALYAVTVSAASNTAATPEDAKDKKHHLKDGQGFTNPWDSYRHESLPNLLGSLLKCGFDSPCGYRASELTLDTDGGSMDRGTNPTLHHRRSMCASLTSSRAERRASSARRGSATPATTSSFPRACASSSIQASATGAAPSASWAPHDIPKLPARSKIYQ